ncbi:MAG TPA: MtrB/PioB family outer membrane beta-barrel protein [Burkholderiales bacterium]|nr:MtrB/PioB family outer membrane beta-barrel protein [Burkholderiales bacterium]
MERKLLSVLVAGLFVPTFAGAQETQTQKEWSGSVTVGGRHVSESASDPSKLNEYRDLSEGTKPIGAFELRQRGESNYLNAYGENLGRDDQYLNLQGGRYGTYKYRLYDNELRHNFGSGPGALSPYIGIGGTTLTGTFPNTNPATWNSFDHSYKRRDVGGFAEWQAASPFYFRLDGNEVTRKGINVFAGAKGTSPGNGFMDLPTPIDYTTRNVSGEAGYSSKRGHLAINLMHSSFDNGNALLRWQNDFFGNGLDTTVLTPSNDLTRLAINGNLRQLPMDSTLAGRFTTSHLTNDVNIQQTMLSTGGAFPATNPNESSFHGDIKNTTASVSLASHPTKTLDTRLYYDYASQKNDSTEMTFNPTVASGLRLGSTDPRVNCAAAAGVLCSADLFHYRRHDIGAEANYRLSRENRFSGGYEYLHTERERADFPSTKDNKVFVEWKNSSLDWLTSRVKYQFLERRSDFEADVATLAANPMDLFVRRFDFANVNQNLIKAVLDMVPGGGFDVGVEAIFKDNNYKDTQLGRTSDQRQELYLSVGYGDPSRFRVLAFTDFEYTKFKSTHRVGTGNPDPSAPPTTSTYNWNANNTDKSWEVGVGADWKPREKLTLKGSATYAETNGAADFTAQPGGATTVFQPINNFDNTRRTSLSLRAIYDYNRSWEFTGGYAYEHYWYSDIGYDNTKYVTTVGVTAPSFSYTTGQYAFQPYTTNIVYALAKYKF